MSRSRMSYCLLPFFFLSSACWGMEFRLLDEELPAIFGKGEIVDGDSERLRSVIGDAPRDSTGLKGLLLNSPGGDVEAAFEVAKLIEEFGVVTMIPPGAECASACAAILFPSGRYHWVIPGGALGLHSCSFKETGMKAEECNERIGKYAVERGISYGSIWVFMDATKPGEMMWFDSEMTDCWGISSYPEGEEPPGHGNCIFYVLNDMQKNGVLK